MSSPQVPGPGDRLPEEGADAIRARTSLVPQVSIVLGSGLGPALAGDLDEEASFSYADLPGFPPVGVPGHEGRLALGRLAGVPVAAFFGRFHLYEGHGVDVPALLPRLARSLGAGTLILTAAVGGLAPELPAGTVVVVSDHINFMGTNPMRGWRYPDGTPPFVGMAAAWDPDLRALALERARALEIAAAEGVYAAMAGPAFETPAEVAFLRRAGGSVVGMSVVPEAVPAAALGLRLLGLCSVTNALGEHVDHASVIRVSGETAVSVGRLLVDLLPRLHTKGA